MGKKNKVPEAKCGNKPHASKRKIQQSAPLASTVSTMEMANKPKAVTAEATPLSPPPPAEVAKGAEDDRKIAAQPKYVAKPRVAITRAASVEPVAGAKEEHVEEYSLKASAPLLVKKDPELASYHISFLKNYLALLVHFQQHRTSQVSEKIDKSLFNWIHNQKTYLKWYKLGTSEEKKGKPHIDDRYVRYLRKLGIDVVVKLDTEADEE
jgi:hypothetical protein